MYPQQLVPEIFDLRLVRLDGIGVGLRLVFGRGRCGGHNTSRMRWIPSCEKGLNDDRGTDVLGRWARLILTAPLAKWTSANISDVDADL